MRRHYSVKLFYALTFFGFCAPMGVRAGLPPSAPYLGAIVVDGNDFKAPPAPKFSKAQFLNALEEGLKRVDEFQFIQTEADRLGVKVYLFGGTAAAFAHYVKWDLVRQLGDERLFPDRFDYRYVNIYRSTQDLDIVVDGPDSAIVDLQNRLAKEYPYLQGSKGNKSSWEVRSLRETKGEKIALLDNPDFLNQHTDSQSVGMIEITKKADLNKRVRDLRDWERMDDNNFLKDVLESKIHFYFSEKHESTRFFIEGRNPPIVAVIRYFIKVFQLDLNVRPEDEPLIHRIIDSFEPKSVEEVPYLRAWFANNVPKLLQNAIDVENAVKVLDRFNLREKLDRVAADQTQGSISWWMHKQPLMSFPLDQPGQRALIPSLSVRKKDLPAIGVTAGEMDLKVVSHETTSYLVYEAITRSHKGLPNVFISRHGHDGETAAFGDGFYTKPGTSSGYRGSGFTVRFRVDPHAREGVDFERVNHGAYLLIHNRSMLTVIPENLQMDLIGYYSMLASQEQLSKDDLGVFHRLRFSLRPRFAHPQPHESEFLEAQSTDFLLNVLGKDFTPEGFGLILRLLGQRKLEARQVILVDSSIRIFQGSQSGAASDVIAKLNIPALRDSLRRQFLEGAPRFEDFQMIYAQGLFEDHDVEYLQGALPFLSTAPLLLKFLNHWQSNGKSLKQTGAPMRNLLVKLGHRFYSFSPNEEQVWAFANSIGNKGLALALAAYHYEDPLVLGASMGSVLSDALSSKRVVEYVPSTKRVIRFWYHQRERFLSTALTLMDLWEIADKLPLAEVQIDLLKYALDHRLLRRRSDVMKLALVLVGGERLDATSRLAYGQIIDQLVSHFLGMRPSMPELSQFSGLPIFTMAQRERILGQTEFQIKSVGDLIEHLWLISDKQIRNKMLIAHSEWLQMEGMGRGTVAQLLNILDYREASLLVLEKASAVLLKEDPAFLLSLLEQDLKRYVNSHPDIFDKIWLQAFPALLKLGPLKPDMFWMYSQTIPSVRCYRVFLELYLESLNTFELLEHVSLIDLRQVGKSVNPPSKATLEMMGAITDELLLAHLERLAKGPQQANQVDVGLGLATVVASHMLNPKSMMRAFKIFFEAGLPMGGSRFTGIAPKSSLWAYIRLHNDEHQAAIHENLIYFLLTQAEMFRRHSNQFSASVFESILRFLTSNVGFVSLDQLREDLKLEKSLIRYYLLLGIKNLHTRSNDQGGDNPLVDFRGLVRSAEQSRTAIFSNQWVRMIVSQYEAYARGEAVGYQEQRETQLDREIDAAYLELQELVATLDWLKEKTSYLDDSDRVGRCEQVLQAKGK